jgi:hypothetical protein
MVPHGRFLVGESGPVGRIRPCSQGSRKQPGGAASDPEPPSPAGCGGDMARSARSGRAIGPGQAEGMTVAHRCLVPTMHCPSEAEATEDRDPPPSRYPSRPRPATSSPVQAAPAPEARPAVGAGPMTSHDWHVWHVWHELHTEVWCQAWAPTKSSGNRAKEVNSGLVQALVLAGSPGDRPRRSLGPPTRLFMDPMDPRSNAPGTTRKHGRGRQVRSGRATRRQYRSNTNGSTRPSTGDARR